MAVFTAEWAIIDRCSSASFVNGQATEMDHYADHLLTGMIADVLPALLGAT